MADLTTCPTCGATDQEVGKYCEQCGGKVEPVASAPSTPDLSVSPDSPQVASPPVGDQAVMPDQDSSSASVGSNGQDSAAPVVSNGQVDAAPVLDTPPSAVDASGAAGGDALPTVRFIRLENGVLNRDISFEVPVDSRLLLGRTDPANGVFPEVDLTMWSQRVATPEGALYTIHRKQCYISRDSSGRVWVVDHADYVGDTMVSPVGTSQFHPIPALASERETNDEGAVALQVGDRILMGQGEGILIFQLMQM